MAEVTRLDGVDLKNVWPNEASDFTPWLADNLDALGGELGLDDLEHVETEAPVGPFSLDIRAQDADGRAVVIENQLGRTDHEHLGKVLTYAAGYDARAVVWVAGEFRDGHRAALDWLNQRTELETEFYGVVVRAVRIGASLPAAVFDVVARPNGFRKRHIIVDNRQNNKNADAYQQFWQKYLGPLRDEHKLTTARKGNADSWQDFKTGVKGVRYTGSFSKQQARVELYLDAVHLNAAIIKERNKRLFDCLYNQRGRIESAFGEEQMHWERLDNSRACRIYISRPGSISDSQEVLDEIVDWMVRSVVKIHTNVVPIVQEAADAVDGEMEEERVAALRDDEADEGEE